MPTLRPFRSRALDDPAAVRVIAALDAVGAGRSTVLLPVPAAGFRADLRTQLVAITPRLVGDGAPAVSETPPRLAAGAAEAPPRTTHTPSRRPLRTRPMTVLVAGAAVVVLGLGGATWLARSALPGDPLYGLKRTAEGVDVSLAGSQVDKGTALLLDATTRVQEVEQLLGQPQSMALGYGSTAGGSLSTGTTKLVVSTLQAADSNTHKGVITIGDDAVAHGDPAGLVVVVGWADGQKKLIHALVGQVPDSATEAKAQANHSYSEISLAYTRASELLVDVTNGTTCTRTRDEFGPKPCAASTTPGVPGSPSPTPSVSGTGPGGSGGTGGTGSPGGTAGPGGTATNSPGAGTGGSTPGTTPATSVPPAGNLPNSIPTSIPTNTAGLGLPAVTSSAPVVGVDSCGVQVTLPVGGVTIGTCPPR